MSKVGFQVYGLFGSRAIFTRDAVGGTTYPPVDLGTIEPVSPNVTTEEAVLEDSESGVRKEVDKAITKISETAEIVCKNLSIDNLAFLFLAERPVAFEQAAGLHVGTHEVHAGSLIQCLGASGERLYSLYRIVAVFFGTQTLGTTLTDIDPAAGTLEFTTTDPAVSNGQFIVLPGGGLANAAVNAGTYKVVSKTGSGPWVYTVTGFGPDAIAESPAAGQWMKKDAGTICEAGVDYDDYRLQRGIIKAIDGGAFGDFGDAATSGVSIIVQAKAITGNRLIKPTDLKGEIKGTMELYWASDNYEREMVRRCRVALSPGGSQFTATDFSQFTLNLRVLSDLTADDVAGDMVATVGDLPDETS